MIAFIRVVLIYLAVASPVLATEVPKQSIMTAALFEQNYPLTRGVLVADFPMDLRALEQGFVQIDNTEILPQLKLQRLFMDLTALRKRYASKLAYARTQKSALLVLSLAEFYRNVMRHETPDVCGAFASDGAGILLARGQGARYAKDMDRQAAVYFSAVASALENPDVVGRASQADWSMVMGQIVADGHPASYIGVIAKAKASDPELCPALLALFGALVEVKPSIAQRVRAEFIQGVTGY